MIGKISLVLRWIVFLIGIPFVVAYAFWEAGHGRTKQTESE